MSKHDAFSTPPASNEGETSSTLGDYLDDLVDAGTSVIENVASQVTEYTQGISSSAPAAAASAQSSQSACAAQGGKWLTPGSALYQGDGNPYCAFFPPEMVAGIALCDKINGVYDAAFNRCVSKAAATQPYTAQDLECSKQGKVYNYLVQSCVTFEESKLLEQNNADLICGKDSVLTETPEGFKGCYCKPGYDWKDSGATTDCVKKASTGGAVTKPSTVKPGKTAPPVNVTPVTDRYKKTETNWALYGGIAAAVAVLGGAYWYSKKKGGKLGTPMRHYIFQPQSRQRQSTVGVIPLIIFSPSAIAAAYACYQTGICPDGGGSDEEQAAIACLQAGGTFSEDGDCLYPGIQTGAGTIQDKIGEGGETATATTTSTGGTSTPPKSSSGGSKAPTPVSGSTTVVTPPPSAPTKYNWPLIAAVVGVVAVGGAYAYKKYKK